MSAAVIAAEDLRSSLARRSLLDFGVLVYPGFAVPPHVRLMASYLERLEKREIRRLIVAVSVRHGKSILCSQVYPSWSLGRDPSQEIMLTSHAESLAVRNSRMAKSLLLDARWPFPDVVLAPDSTSSQRWHTKQGGSLYAVGVGGGVTGRGVDRLVIDDPLHDALSIAERDGCWAWYTDVIVPRLNSNATIVLVSARFAEDDLAGRILASEEGPGWAVLRLPAICDSDDDALGRKIGEPLWPEHMSLRELESRRTAMGSRSFSAQFQQRPVPLEGNLIKREWVRYDAKFPSEFERIVVGIDAAAKTGIWNDFSALAVIGKVKRDYYLLDMIRRKVEFPELRRLTIAVFEKYAPSTIYIEDASNGTGLLQELRRESSLPVVAIHAKGSKIARVEGISGLIESGRLHLPREAPWLADFEREMFAFPSGTKSPDQLDALVLALMQLRRSDAAVPWSFAFAKNR